MTFTSCVIPRTCHLTSLNYYLAILVDNLPARKLVNKLIQVKFVSIREDFTNLTLKWLGIFFSESVQLYCLSHPPPPQ
jgi:hypothetical protein